VQNNEGKRRKISKESGATYRSKVAQDIEGKRCNVLKYSGAK